jgi:uncharacterized protein HemY
MASTIEMYIATLALILNSFLILVLFFLGNIILAPIFSQLEKMVVGPQTIQMTDIGYITPAIWAILLLMEIVCIIAFLATVARRDTVEDYYGGY